MADEDALAVAAQHQAEAVAARPAHVVVDRLHGSHLLDGLPLQHGLVGLGEKPRPPAEVAHGSPQLAGRDPGPGLDGRLVPDALDVRLHEIARRGRCRGLEARACQSERLQEPLPDVLGVRHTGHTLDDDAEQGEGEVGVVEAGTRRQHLLRAVERLEQLRDCSEASVQPGVVVRLALKPRGVRKQPAQRRGVGGSLDVRVERVLEIELPVVAQLHDRRRGEGLRDRADAVLRVR